MKKFDKTIHLTEVVKFEKILKEAFNLKKYLTNENQFVFKNENNEIIFKKDINHFNNTYPHKNDDKKIFDFEIEYVYVYVYRDEKDSYYDYDEVFTLHDNEVITHYKDTFKNLKKFTKEIREWKIKNLMK